MRDDPMGSWGKGKAVAYLKTDRAIRIWKDANEVLICFILFCPPFRDSGWVRNRTDAQTVKLNIYQSSQY
jgi:hypothetical protein